MDSNMFEQLIHSQTTYNTLSQLFSANSMKIQIHELQNIKGLTECRGLPRGQQ